MATPIKAELSIDTRKFVEGLRALGALSDAEARKINASLGGIKVDADAKAARDEINDLKRVGAKAGEQTGEAFASKLKGAFSGGNIGDALLGGIIGGGVAGAISSAIGTIQSAATAAFEEYKALDTNIQNIGTLGVEAAGQSLDTYKGLINDLSREVPDSAANIANGVYNAISAGITGSEQDIVNFTKTASQVAVAGLSDTNTAVNALTSVVNAYGLGAAGAEEVSNTFFAAIKAGKTSFGELNAGLANVVPAASAAGVKFDEVAATIAKLTTVGIPTAQATTQIRAALIELQKPAKPLQDVLAKVGLSAANMGEQLRKPASEGGGLLNTLQLVDKAAKESGLSLTQVFGSAEAASAALSVTGANAESALAIFQNVQNDIGDGVAARAFEAASQSLAVQFDILKNNVQAVFNDLFQVIIPIVQSVVDVFRQTLAPAFERIGDTIGPAFERVGKIVEPILAVIGGVIITQIVGAINYAVAVVSTMADIFSRSFDAVQRAIQPLIDTFSDLFGSVGNGVDPVEAFGDILEIAGAVMQETAAIVGELAGLVIELVVTGIQFAVAAVNQLVGLFKSQNDETKGVTESTGKAIPVLEQIRIVFDNMRGTIAGVTFAFREIKLVIQEFFAAIVALEFDKLDDILSGAGARIKSGYDAGFNSVRQMRAEQEAAAAAAEEAARLAVEQAAAADSTARTEKSKKTQLEEALALYRGIERRQKASVDEAVKRLALDRSITDEVRKQREAVIRSDSTKVLSDRARQLFKATTDEFGFFASTALKLTGEETDTEIRSIFAGLVSVADGFNADLLLKPIKDAIAASKDEFKGLSTDVLDGLLPTDLYEQRVAALVDSLRAEQSKIAFTLPLLGSLKDQEAAQKAIADLQAQIDAVQAESADNVIEAERKAVEGRVALNKRRLEILREDEIGNRADILQLLQENLSLETNLKLQAITSTGDARAEETQLILKEAEKQAAAIQAEWGTLPGVFDRIAVSISGNLVDAFQGLSAEARKAREEQLKSIEDQQSELIKGMKEGEEGLQSFAAAMRDFADQQANLELPSIGDLLLQALQVTGSDTFEQLQDEYSKNLAKLLGDVKEFSQLGSEQLEIFGQATAFAFGAALTNAVADGQLTFDEILQSLASTASSALDILFPVISAQFIAWTTPFLGPILAATAIAGLKALLSAATAGIGGAERGVEGITAAFSQSRGSTDTIPIYMAPGEGVTTAAGVRQYPGLTTAINQGTVDKWLEKHPDLVTHKTGHIHVNVMADKRMLRETQLMRKQLENLTERVESLKGPSTINLYEGGRIRRTETVGGHNW